MRCSISIFIIIFCLQSQIGFSQNGFSKQQNEFIDSIRSEQLYENFLLVLERKENNLNKILDLKNSENDTYKSLADYFENIGKAYIEIYRYPILRKRYSKYLKKVANKFVSQNQPILIIHGNNSKTLSVNENQKGNNLNIQFIRIHDYQEENKPKFYSEDEVIKHIESTGGVRLKLFHPTKKLDNFLLISAIEKFNEYIIEALEKKHKIDEVLEILKSY